MHPRAIRKTAIGRSFVPFVAAALLSAGCQVAEKPATAPRPAAVSVEGVPEVPRQDFEDIRRYRDINFASFVDWFPDGGLLVASRYGNLTQLHRVEAPLQAPALLTRGDDPVSQGRCLPDGTVLFSRGKGGDENFQLYRLDPQSGDESLLTDGKSRNLLSRPSPDGKRIAFTSTKRNGKDADVYILDLEKGGEPELVFPVDGETWTLESWSPDGSSAALLHYVSANESYLRILDLAAKTSRELPPELPGLAKDAKVSRSELHFGSGGRSLIFVSDARGEFQELVRLDLESDKAEWLSDGISWDVDEVDVSRDGLTAAFTVNRDGYSDLYVIEGLDGRIVRRRIQLDDALVGGLAFDGSGRRLGLGYGTPTASVEAAVFDLDGASLKFHTRSDAAGFQAADFSAPVLIRYPSHDAREIPAFVYLPKRRPSSYASRIPVLINIHGGPESQHRPGFSSLIQHHVRELGIAVIAPNVRGSTGYGKTYSLLDNGLKREDAVRDIGALLDWIRDQGSVRYGLDPERVAVNGGSYGGFMVLASLVRFGERLRAGIDAVGVSDFITFLENTSAYRRHLRRAEYGDERDPEMRRFFEAISPARNIGRLRSALLLVHGKNDPRVPFSETVQVVERARATGQPVWTLYADNEGHGFTRKENRDYQEATAVMFLREFVLTAPAPAPVGAAATTSGRP
jgi:dipeptidyl aminopeptidase/acylaminoacyl peptidase